MPRRMAFSMTPQQIIDQTKTVTRRHIDTWKSLTAGDRLTAIEKGMGLPKGSKQVVLAELVIVSNRIEKLAAVNPWECTREGLGDMSPPEFCEFWAKGHGYGTFANLVELYQVECRRIEFAYL